MTSFVNAPLLLSLNVLLLCTFSAYKTSPEYTQDLTYCDEICDANLNIEATDKGYRIIMMVPSPYFKYIIGKKGETKKRIEVETRSQILVPKPGEQREEIGKYQ